MRGVVNDAMALYFRDATLAAAFVVRWCSGFAAYQGFYKFRDDEPTLDVYGDWGSAVPR